MSIIYLFDILFIYIFVTLLFIFFYFSVVKRKEWARTAFINLLITGTVLYIIRCFAIFSLITLSNSKNQMDLISNVFGIITAILLLIILILAIAKEDDRIKRYSEKIKVILLICGILMIACFSTTILLKIEASKEPHNPPPIARNIKKDLKGVQQ